MMGGYGGYGYPMSGAGGRLEVGFGLGENRVVGLRLAQGRIRIVDEFLGVVDTPVEDGNTSEHHILEGA